MAMTSAPARAQPIRLAQGNPKAAYWLGVTPLKMREKLAQFALLPGREIPNKSTPEESR